MRFAHAPVRFTLSMHRRHPVFLALHISLVLLLAFAATAQMPGGTAFAQETAVVHEGVAGPFRVAVEVVPPLPVAGRVQFRVRPVDASTAVAVPDAQIEIYLARNEREELKTPALNSPADRTTYIGNADLDQVGEWNVRVEVKSNAGTGDFAFAMPVRPRARSGGGLVAPTFVYLGGAVLILGGVAWLVLASRRARARTPTRSAAGAGGESPADRRPPPGPPDTGSSKAR